MQPWQITTVWACEKTVVMVKQPGHLTSMKKDRGAGTRVCFGRHVSTCAGIEMTASSSVTEASGDIGQRTLSLCFLASAAGLGLRRSTARTCGGEFC